MLPGEGRTFTEVATFRLPKYRIVQLRKEAKEQSLTTNVLLNHIVEDYFDFVSVASRAGMMPCSKRLIRELMNALEEREISNLAKSAATSDIPDLVYMKTNKFTAETLIDTLLAWARHSGFAYRDTYEGDLQTISLQHNMGSRWSGFLSEVLEITFKKLDVGVSFERPDDMLVIHVKRKYH